MKSGQRRTTLSPSFSPVRSPKVEGKTPETQIAQPTNMVDWRNRQYDQYLSRTQNQTPDLQPVQDFSSKFSDQSS